MSKAIVTFILITYKEPTADFYVSLGSLLKQKNPNWKAIVMQDGPLPDDTARKVVEEINDERITYFETEQNEGAWGCYNRIRGLKMADTDFVVNATVQEYYTPNTVDEIEKNKNYDFIYWPCVHHSFNYDIINAEPVKGRIDWSNFAIKSVIARRVGINFPDAYMADGVFVEECIASGHIKKKIKINKLLNIKN
jgi:hypothetical protein